MAEPGVNFEIVDLAPMSRAIILTETRNPEETMVISYDDAARVGRLLCEWAADNLQTLPHGVVVKVR